MACKSPRFSPETGFPPSPASTARILRKKSTPEEVLGYFKLVRWLPVQENV